MKATTNALFALLLSTICIHSVQAQTTNIIKDTSGINTTTTVSKFVTVGGIQFKYPPDTTDPVFNVPDEDNNWLLDWWYWACIEQAILNDQERRQECHRLYHSGRRREAEICYENARRWYQWEIMWCYLNSGPEKQDIPNSLKSNPFEYPQKKKKPTITVSPNPFQNAITILLQSTETANTTYELINLVGEVISSGTISGTSEYILETEAGLPTGIYLLNVRNNHFNSTHKLIKQ